MAGAAPRTLSWKSFRLSTARSPKIPESAALASHGAAPCAYAPSRKPVSSSDWRRGSAGGAAPVAALARLAVAVARPLHSGLAWVLGWARAPPRSGCCFLLLSLDSISLSQNKLYYLSELLPFPNYMFEQKQGPLVGTVTLAVSRRSPVEERIFLSWHFSGLRVRVWVVREI